MIRIALFVALTIAPASAETLTCSTWQGTRTCTSPDGYVSRESTWNGLTTGDDNRGDRWSTSKWLDNETIAVTPRQER
jgi:hypothetical protein